MIVKAKHAHQFFAYGGAHAFLLVMAFQIGGSQGWMIATPLMATVSLYAWIATLRRYRMVGDTPTSQVASAAQGYVELIGFAENSPNTETLAPLTNKPCCWFRYETEESDRDDQWRTVDEGESAIGFQLRDTSGACMVDPKGAEIMCAHKESWTQGDHRYTEWRIEAGDPLYVIGDFKTRRFAPSAEEVREDIGDVLIEWKKDQGELSRRFDLNQNGRVDDTEWQLARTAAKREVERKHAELRALPSVDVLMKPSDGRAFLISNHEPETFHRRLLWWAWAHLAILLGALSASIYFFLQ